MGQVVDFEPKRKLIVSVCDSTQNYQAFEAESVTVPEISFQEHEVWYGEEKTHVSLGHEWSPATIVGPQEIADAIRTGISPIRVTFEHRPKSDCWWELHEAYLSTSSTPETHVIHFRAATRHE